MGHHYQAGPDSPRTVHAGQAGFDRETPAGSVTRSAADRPVRSPNRATHNSSPRRKPWAFESRATFEAPSGATPFDHQGSIGKASYLERTSAAPFWGGFGSRDRHHRPRLTPWAAFFERPFHDPAPANRARTISPRPNKPEAHRTSTDPIARQHGQISCSPRTGFG